MIINARGARSLTINDLRAMYIANRAICCAIFRYGTDRNFSLYAEDYVKLYIGVVRDETLKYDDSRDFLTSSPTNGIKSEEEGFIAENPYSLYYGDGNL